MTTLTSSLLDQYADHFAPEYNPYPHGRFISVLLLRQVASEAMFRTEGSGEPLNTEFVFPGTTDADPIARVVISKRKQTAVERRIGRELLREHNLLHMAGERLCALNTNTPCGMCIDCMLYGYAAGGGGAQRSRIITDDAFSLHPAATILGERQFNALFDNSTMRDPETNKPSTSIGTDPYVKPEAVFLDIETLKDITRDEFRYILGNILRASRYGAISSRIGRVHNHIVGLAFSQCELFSNLEWVQHTYANLHPATGGELDFPLHITRVQHAAHTAATTLSEQVFSHVTFLPPAELATLQTELHSLYSDPEQLTAFLQRLATSYPQPAAEQGKGKRGKKARDDSGA